MRLIILFLMVSTLNVNAWEKEHKSFLNECNRESFDKFHKTYGDEVKDFKDRSEVDNMITNLFFSTYLSPSDPSYSLYNDCGVYFSKFYNGILEKEEADFELINKWEHCFEISYNGHIPKKYVENIECLKNTFLPK